MLRFYRNKAVKQVRLPGEEAGGMTRARPWLRISAGLALVFAGIILFRYGSVPEAASPMPAAPVPAEEDVPVRAKHVETPKEVRGIYVTASTASLSSRFNDLIDSVAEKGINSVVLDLKGERGALAFAPESSLLKERAPIKTLIKDIDGIVGSVHQRGLYLIARIPVFEDPDYAAKHPQAALKNSAGGLWKDAKGLYWLDPADQGVWEYNAEIAKEAYRRGFDEVQFDYIRFATDGKTSQIVFPAYDPQKESRRETMSRLFAYLDHELRGAGIPVSIDVFGLVAWHESDLGIGQWYPDALRHFDFVSAMVYPSHYFSGTLGLANPAEHPYEIVLDSMNKGNEAISELVASGSSEKIGKQRPWLQAFNLGAVYTPQMIMAQVRAAREAGCQGFLFWNASNNYSSLPSL